MKEIVHIKRLSPTIMQIIFAEGLYGLGSDIERYEINLGRIFPRFNWEETTVNYTEKYLTFCDASDFSPYKFPADCFYDLVILVIRGENERI